MAASTVRLKLLIDTKNKRVLFAEAENDFVDFIFHILSLPLASISGLLISKEGMVGCLNNLYESLENLDYLYIENGHNKGSLLKPQVPNPIASVPLLGLKGNPSAKTFYKCPNSSNSTNTYRSKKNISRKKKNYSPSNYRNNCRSYVTDDSTAKCPECNSLMDITMSYVAPPTTANDGGGFVEGVFTYMVMDDLMVKPVSTKTISDTVTLLNNFDVKDLGSLQETEVNVGMNEALKLLKASLDTNKVLTSVFISDM